MSMDSWEAIPKLPPVEWVLGLRACWDVLAALKAEIRTAWSQTL